MNLSVCLFRAAAGERRCSELHLQRLTVDLTFFFLPLAGVKFVAGPYILRGLRAHGAGAGVTERRIEVEADFILNMESPLFSLSYTDETVF
jgi:hypothetical protein